MWYHFRESFLCFREKESDFWFHGIWKMSLVKSLFLCEFFDNATKYRMCFRDQREDQERIYSLTDSLFGVHVPNKYWFPSLTTERPWHFVHRVIASRLHLLSRSVSFTGFWHREYCHHFSFSPSCCYCSSCGETGKLSLQEERQIVEKSSHLHRWKHKWESHFMSKWRRLSVWLSPLMSPRLSTSFQIQKGMRFEIIHPIFW